MKDNKTDKLELYDNIVTDMQIIDMEEVARLLELILKSVRVAKDSRMITDKDIEIMAESIGSGIISGITRFIRSSIAGTAYSSLIDLDEIRDIIINSIKVKVKDFLQNDRHDNPGR